MSEKNESEISVLRFQNLKPGLDTEPMVYKLSCGLTGARGSGARTSAQSEIICCYALPKTVLGTHNFAVAAAVVWSLPPNLRSLPLSLQTSSET